MQEVVLRSVHDEDSWEAPAFSRHIWLHGEEVPAGAGGWTGTFECRWRLPLEGSLSDGGMVCSLH